MGTTTAEAGGRCLVLVGAIVVGVEGNELGRQCQCIDERQRRWALFGVPGDAGQAVTVLLEAVRESASRTALTDTRSSGLGRRREALRTGSLRGCQLLGEGREPRERA